MVKGYYIKKYDKPFYQHPGKCRLYKLRLWKVPLLNTNKYLVLLFNHKVVLFIGVNKS